MIQSVTELPYERKHAEELIARLDTEKLGTMNISSTAIQKEDLLYFYTEVTQFQFSILTHNMAVHWPWKKWALQRPLNTLSAEVYLLNRAVTDALLCDYKFNEISVPVNPT